MTYSELSAAARGGIGPFCRACPVCDGRACAGVIPGPGDKGVGRVAHRNWQAWQGLRVSMDTLHDTWAADTGTTVLGQRLSLPVMVGPVGDVQRHYGERYDTVSYNRCALEAAAGEGTLAWTGDGLDASIMTEACGLIAELGGRGVPTVKPWDEVTLGEKLDEALAARPAAVAMDIDAAGLPFLRGQEPPAGAKSAAQVGEVVARCHEAGVPFALKGVMTPSAAARAAEAGVDAIVVSNHGGRVLDGTPATAEVLPAIVDAVGERVEVLVDGGGAKRPGRLPRARPGRAGLPRVPPLRRGHVRRGSRGRARLPGRASLRARRRHGDVRRGHRGRRHARHALGVAPAPLARRRPDASGAGATQIQKNGLTPSLTLVIFSTHQHTGI